MLAQILEHLGKIGIDIIHVGILLLGLGNERLQRRILIESQELSVNLLIIHLTDTQHILDKRAGLHGINGVHLLQSRKIAGGKVQTLDTVVAINLNNTVVACCKLPFTANASKEHYQQKIIYLAHGLFLWGNDILMLKNSLQIY